MSPRSARTAGAPSAATTRWRGTSRTSTSSRTHCTCASSVIDAIGRRIRSRHTRVYSTGALVVCWRDCSRRRLLRMYWGAGLPCPCSHRQGCTISDSSHRVPDARRASARPNNRLLQPQVQIYYYLLSIVYLQCKEKQIISEEEHIFFTCVFSENKNKLCIYHPASVVLILVVAA